MRVRATGTQIHRGVAFLSTGLSYLTFRSNKQNAELRVSLLRTQTRWRAKKKERKITTTLHIHERAKEVHESLFIFLTVIRVVPFS